MIDMTIDMSIPVGHSHFSGNGSCDETRRANKRADRMARSAAAAMTPYRPAGVPEAAGPAPYLTDGADYGPEHAWPETAEEGMNSIPQDSFNEPLNADEAARNSWRALLARNVGRSVLVRFLMGTQNLITVEGELYEVGTDYIVIYQPSWDSHITADLYSVKFVEFREPPGQQLG